MIINNDYIKTGFSKTIISPQNKYELSGYGYFLDRLANGILDNIYTKALFFEFKGVQVLFIANDIIGISGNLTDEICRKISEITKIPDKNIFLSCTHTHSAPATIELTGCGVVNKTYLKYFKQKVINNSTIAVRNIFNTKVKFKKILINSFAYNRSKDNLKYIKSNMFFMSLITKIRKVLLIQYSAHPTILSNKSGNVSKDYVCVFDKLIRNIKFNEYLFFNGACGDIIPFISKKESLTKSTSDSQVSIQRFKKEVNSLNKQILINYNKTKWQKHELSKIILRRKNIKIFYDVPNFIKDKIKIRRYFEESFYDKIDLKKGLIGNIKENNSVGLISKSKRVKGIQRFILNKLGKLQINIKLNKLKKFCRFEIVLINIGNIKILTFPLELPLAFEKSLRQIYPNLLIFCYTNNLLGYIYTKDTNECYVKRRGPLIYNLFPFKDNSFNKILKETLKLLK